MAAFAALRRLDGLMQRFPVAFACGTATVKSTSADIMVQNVIERRERWDVERTVAFGLFGFSWMGAGQYWLYVRVLPTLLPATTVPSTLGKVFLDQFLHVPFIFMPFFYLVDGAVQKEPVVQYARDKWHREIVETMVANW